MKDISNTTEQKNYSAIDFFKLLMAVFIIVLHTSPFMDFSKLIEVGIRDCIVIIAVPFFFMTTGFFALKNEKTAKKSMTHLFRLYIIWSVIYLPFSIIKNHETGQSIQYYIKSFFLWGSFDTIWYLLAAGVAVAISYFFLKRNALNWAVVLGLFFYVIALLGTSYAGIMQNTYAWVFYEKYYEFFNTFKNGVFFGLVFVSMGGLLRQKWENGSVLKKNLIPITLASLVLVIIESAILILLDISTKGVDMKFFLLPFSVFVLLLLVNTKLEVKPKIAIHARKLSTLMFLTHRIFMTSFFMFGIYDQVNSMIWFIIILVSTIAFSELILVLSKKVKNIKELY